MPWEIKLPCGRVTQVDSDIWHKWRHLAWYADWKGSQWQVVCGIPTSFGQQKILLSHLVLPPKVGETIDHANGDTFDNRAKNLRPATHAQQMANRNPHKGRKFKGVFAVGEKWKAQIKSGKIIYLGLFASEIEAARAYNKAAKRLHGEFARLNPV